MAIEMKIPSPGESITEVEIASWVKADGDYVEKDEVLCEIETDKATLPLFAEASGTLSILIQEGEAANVGDHICTIDETAAPAASTPSKAPESAPAPATPAAAAPPETPQNSHAAGHPSVAAKKILDEAGIPSNAVQGTGKGERITKADAIRHTEQAQTSSTASSSSEIAAAPVAPGSRGTRNEKMSKLRRTIAKRLVDVKNNTAMLTTFNEVDMSHVMKIRSEYKDAFLEKHDVKLGFMSFFTRAAAAAAADFPAVNAQVEDDHIVYHDYVDVGIAVSAPKGLVVPVVRNTESMSLAQIETEILRLAKLARDNKLSIDDMTGGTFSITNGGIFGSMLSTPIINPPQSAILGLHNIVQRPVAVDGEVKIRPVMYIALSYDHRIIDGREAVGFLYKIKECIESPVRLLLDV